MKYGIFISLIFLNLSCATIKYDQRVSTQKSFPEIAVESKASIGDTIVMQKTISYASGVEITKNVQNGKIRKGNYVRIGVLSDYAIYTPIPSTGAAILYPTYSSGSFYLGKRNVTTGTQYDRTIGEEEQLHLIYYDGSLVAQSYKFDKSEYVEIENIPIEDTNNFQQYLIYTGKENNTLKFSYREFSGDLARPSYTIDVTYDLNESSIVAFRNVRLRVLQATNVEIKYILMSNFNIN